MKTLILAGFLSSFAHNKCTMAVLDGACKSCGICPFTNSNFGCKKYGVTNHTATKSMKKCLSQDASCGGEHERCYGTKYVCWPGFTRPNGSSEYDVKCAGRVLNYGPVCAPAVKCTPSDTARSSVGDGSTLDRGASVEYTCKDGWVGAKNSSGFTSKCVVGSSLTVGELSPNPENQCAVEVRCPGNLDCSSNSENNQCDTSTGKCVQCTEKSHCAGDMLCLNNKCACEAGFLSAPSGECLLKCPGSSQCLPNSECISADGSVRCPCSSVDSNGHDLEVRGTNACLNPCENKPQSSCEYFPKLCEWGSTCKKKCLDLSESACASGEGCSWDSDSDLCLVDDFAHRNITGGDISALMLPLMAALLFCCFFCACWAFLRKKKTNSMDEEKIHAASMSSGSAHGGKYGSRGSSRSKASKARRAVE